MNIEHIANLARIELNNQEKKKYQEQLGKILNYFEKLEKLDISGVETADGGTRDLENVWRKDTETQKHPPALSHEASRSGENTKTKNLIGMAPEKEKGQIKVNKVL